MAVLSSHQIFLNECDRENSQPPRFNTCPACDGYGEVGTGRMSHSVNTATIDPPWEITEACRECNGTGWVEEEDHQS